MSYQKKRPKGIRYSFGHRKEFRCCQTATTTMNVVYSYTGSPKKTVNLSKNHYSIWLNPWNASPPKMQKDNTDDYCFTIQKSKETASGPDVKKSTTNETEDIRTTLKQKTSRWLDFILKAIACILNILKINIDIQVPKMGAKIIEFILRVIRDIFL